MQFLLTTLGCKVNQYESAVISASLERFGFTPAPVITQADVFIVNSCTVTEAATAKTRRLINSAKRKNPRLITVLAGCFPQAYPDVAKNLAADIICGVSEREQLPTLINTFAQSRTAIEQIGSVDNIYQDFSLHDSLSTPQITRTRAFIKIQDGCDCNCAYCIVPTARGNPRSRPLESISREARAMVEVGYKEIVLTGINLAKHEDFCGAVLAVAESAKSAESADYTLRIRLSSLEPDLLTRPLLEKLATVPHLCPHFHLSLQSGSEGVLNRMGRRYTAAEYYEKVQLIREFFPNNTAFTTDMMTGFPGETDDEFAESLAFARKIGFAKIHVFPFSPRPGTRAAEMPLQIPEPLKLERRDRLMQTADDLRREFFTAQIGKTLQVLVEKRTSPDSVFGHSENYTPVKITSRDAEKNTFLHVKITEIGDKFCAG